MNANQKPPLVLPKWVEDMDQRIGNMVYQNCGCTYATWCDRHRPPVFSAAVKS